MEFDLFGAKEEIIRTLGFYQPFGSLMLHGKIETRWCRVNRKPPFPLGKYLFYSTLNHCSQSQLFDWCGAQLMHHISTTLENEATKKLDGYAIAVGDLVGISTLNETLRWQAFVEAKGIIKRNDKNDVEHDYIQRTLRFENVQRIEPFAFDFGKQGVGILPESERQKLKYSSNDNHMGAL